MTCRNPHRFSFLVKDGYLHAALAALDDAEADSGKYLGRTWTARTSCWSMTKDLPWGSHVMTSVMVGSDRMRMRRCGKISRMHDVVVEVVVVVEEVDGWGVVLLVLVLVVVLAADVPLLELLLGWS